MRGPARQRAACTGDRRQLLLHGTDLLQTGPVLPDHRRDLVQHGEDFGYAALVEHRHLHALADQRRGDVGLHVGKAEDTVRLQFQDAVDFGAGEGAHARLFVTRAARTHGVARDADDAALLPKQIQPLGCLLGHADDTLRALRKGKIRGHRFDDSGAMDRPAPVCDGEQTLARRRRTLTILLPGCSGCRYRQADAVQRVTTFYRSYP